MASEHNSMKAILYAFGANLGIGIVKTAAAIFTGSGAMLAEAIHSYADTANQLLLIIGIKQSKKKPTEQHPLGYGKAVYFWSFLVALMLFSMGGMFSIYEGFHKLHSHEEISYPWVAAAALIIGIVLEGGSLFGAIHEINKIRGKRNLLQWFRQSRRSELIVVFGEDLAAVIGLFLALVAITLSAVTGNPIYDALGTITIGILLVVVAFSIAIEVKSLLLGESADEDTKKKIKEFLNNRDEIESTYNLITLQFGKDLMVSIKAQMKETMSAGKLLAAINAVESDLREEFPEIRFIFFEPDVTE